MVGSEVVRTCVGCRERATAHELLRLVAGEDEHGPAVVPDPRRVAPGRGAHLHPTLECLALAMRRRAFPRALRVTGGLSTTTLHQHLERPRTPTEDQTQTTGSTDPNWSTSS